MTALANEKATADEKAVVDAPTVPRRWLGLFAILTATLMNLLDASIVNVALPVIRTDLGGSYATLQWIAASYTLVLAMGLLTGGRLGDMYGRYRMLMYGLAGFLAASVLCGIAWSPGSLVTGRVLQALFAALMVPQCFGLIRDLFPGEEQAKAWGVFGPSIGLASILGPVMAGLLIKADLFGSGWRMIFLINLVLGAFTLVAGRRSLPRAGGDRTGGLDLVGTGLAGLAMALLVYPLIQGREHGWPAWTFLMLAASVVVFVVFAWQQVHRKAAGAAPLIELSVFARRSYTSGVLFVIVFLGALMGFSLAVGLMLQLGLHYSPIGASLAMAPWAIGAFAGSAVGAMAPQLGRKSLHIGLTIMAVGTVGLLLVFDTSGIGLGSWNLLVPLLICGIGMGMIFVPMYDIIMGEIQDHEVGTAAGALESFQQLGAALGVAALGTVFFDRFTDPARDLTALKQGALAAAEQVTLISLGLFALAFLVGFLLPRKARQSH
ncbi:MFS transporter [Actinomadura sp. 6N118]|uniref:MFS transporter n=1 Tax=Actinomadura sp. 6N118 TaxID=3375151 RepID=UPI0037A40D96